MNKPIVDFKPEEIMISCIAKEIKNGDVLAQGIATPLVASGYILAKMTHAPDSVFLYTIGNTLSRDGGKVALSTYEDLSIGRALKQISFTDISCEILSAVSPKEFFRPAQIDMWGNFNNIVIGDYAKPKVRLPGCAGIADVTTYYENIYIYVPRHNKNTFVEKIDFISGVGYLSGQSQKEREMMGITSPGPKKIITDLCVFNFETGRVALESLHPGVSLEQVVQNTGFEIILPDEIKETQLPTAEELDLLRNVIDPYGIRELELLSGKKRFAKIREIYQQETAG
jgi:glutaconate CoA-transferase subunit B